MLTASTMSNNLKVPDTAITPFITQLHIGSSRSSTLLVITNRSVKEMPLQLLLFQEEKGELLYSSGKSNGEKIQWTSQSTTDTKK